MRRRIEESGVIEILINFIHDHCQLSREQVSAAMFLAGRVLPSLANAALPSDEDDEDDDIPTEIEIRIVDPKT